MERQSPPQMPLNEGWANASEQSGGEVAKDDAVTAASMAKRVTMDEMRRMVSGGLAYLLGCRFRQCD